MDSRLTDFQKFIKFLIEFDGINDPENYKVIKSQISSMINSMLSSSEQQDIQRKEKEVCLFLRRICLAEHFLLDNDVNPNENEIIDWDEILSTSNLSKRYDVKYTSVDISNNEEFIFKPFVFTKFPKNFLSLYEKPYNIPIDDMRTSTYIFFDIINFNSLIKYYDDFGDTENETEKFSINYFGVYHNMIPYLINIFHSLQCPTITMLMTNSSPCLYLLNRNYYCSLEPFYVDKFGCPDISHRRNQPLLLNEEIYEKIIDRFLSGDFSYNLKLYKINYS